MPKSVKILLSNLSKKLNSITAGDIMTTRVVSTTEDSYLSDVAETMIKERISGLPVMNKKGKVVGIITETDFFLVMDMITSGDIVENGKLEKSHPTVKFAMTTEVVKIKKSTNLNKIISLMKYRNTHTFPVFEDNIMVGIVGRRDVFRSFYAAVKSLHM
ncbi:MAG: CBS domain-containing protein [Candidatus Omnitrophica bacterium]|nr:CBS domain-containing protein [Candidatus Omnitrophota bacterium]